MDLLDLAHAFMRRSSQFSVNDWLTTFSCILALAYVLLLGKGSLGCRS